MKASVCSAERGLWCSDAKLRTHKAIVMPSCLRQPVTSPWNKLPLKESGTYRRGCAHGAVGVAYVMQLWTLRFLNAARLVLVIHGLSTVAVQRVPGRQRESTTPRLEATALCDAAGPRLVAL